jgi:hypothetical protein
VPTFESLARFDREFRRLPRELQTAFLAMLPTFIAALRTARRRFRPGSGSSECRARKCLDLGQTHADLLRIQIRA